MASNEAYLEALRTERAGYERMGRADRLADVDAEIDRVSALLSPPEGEAAAPPVQA